MKGRKHWLPRPTWGGQRHALSLLVSPPDVQHVAGPGFGRELRGPVLSGGGEADREFVASYPVDSVKRLALERAPQMTCVNGLRLRFGVQPVSADHRVVPHADRVLIPFDLQPGAANDFAR